jgi:hypothetical protein
MTQTASNSIVLLWSKMDSFMFLFLLGNTISERKSIQVAGIEAEAKNARTSTVGNPSVFGFRNAIVFATRPHMYLSFFTIVTWLILPVVICLSQRLSHACLSIKVFYT